MAAKFAPVLDRLELFETETEILPGVRALDADGHTPGNTVFELNSDSERGMLIGDLVHSQGELVHRWDCNFSLDRPQALEATDRFRKYIYDNKLPFAASHFPGMKWGRLVNDTGAGISYETID